MSYEIYRIKPLEWAGDVAVGITGVYRLETFDDGVWWGHNGIRHARCENAIEAKTAAQADYEQRIYSAIEFV